MQRYRARVTTWRMKVAPLGTMVLLLLVACASPAPPLFALDALLADPPAYAAQHYAEREMTAALIADLTAAGFTCRHSATASMCERSQHAFASCWDVSVVHIAPGGPIEAEQNRRCMGAQP